MLEASPGTAGSIFSDFFLVVTFFFLGSSGGTEEIRAVKVSSSLAFVSTMPLASAGIAGVLSFEADGTFTVNSLLSSPTFGAIIPLVSAGTASGTDSLTSSLLILSLDGFRFVTFFFELPSSLGFSLDFFASS